MKLDFIFHGGANLNAKMYQTAGFDDVCRKAFERWHLRIEGNAFNKEGRFLDMPVTEDVRLAIRTFWVKQAGARAECFYLGVRLTKDSYREAGEYYRLVAALRALSFGSVKEYVSSGQPLNFTLTMPMRRQSIWKPFSELSGTRVIGSEKFDEKLEDILMSVSVNNLDDWFNKMCLAINPFAGCPEFNVVASRIKPRCIASPGFPSQLQPLEFKAKSGHSSERSHRGLVVSCFFCLTCGVVIGCFFHSMFVSKKDGDLIRKHSYDTGIYADHKVASAPACRTKPTQKVPPVSLVDLVDGSDKNACVQSGRASKGPLNGECVCRGRSKEGSDVDQVEKSYESVVDVVTGAVRNVSKLIEGLGGRCGSETNNGSVGNRR